MELGSTRFRWGSAVITSYSIHYTKLYERGFIRAEVIAYADFIALKSEARCREAGKLRLEGKDYVVHDGDIIHFRFAV